MAHELCLSEDSCIQKALAEGSEMDHLTAIVLSSIDQGYSTETGKELGDPKNVHALQNWTLDFDSGMTIDEYFYRLNVAKASLSLSVYEIMTEIVTESQDSARPVMMNALLDVDRQELEGSVLSAQLSGITECQKLCQAGNEPTQIPDCICYCEKLLTNAFELHKYPRRHYVPSHNTLLFDGVHDANDHNQAAAEDNLAEMELSVSEGRNKLLAKDSVHLLMIISLGVGIVLLFVGYLYDQSTKKHFSLPRPTLSPKPIAAPENRRGYIPVNEEEAKSAAEGLLNQPSTSAAHSVSIKID